MHEWALAEAVISAIIEAANKEDLRKVTEVKIRVGELQQIEEEVLLFALAQLKKTPLEKARFKIEKVKAKMKCRACGSTWVFSKEKLDKSTAEAIHFVPEVAHVYIKCTKCGSPDFEVLEGRGIWLQSITGEK
jgi:hydrogenase nickel incorporation protein HypA/HybF